MLALYVYRYDFNGNRIEQRETNGAGEQITRYRYDNADRLVEVVEPHRTTTYTLDAVGNRTGEKVVDGAGTVLSESTLAYNERDQLTNRDDLITGTHLSQTFDPNGNLDTQTVAGTTRAFTYDHRDRLLAFEATGQSPLRFDYDHEGRRIEKAGASQTTRYQYDLDSLHAETNVIGNTLARYHFSAQQLLVQTITGTTPRHRSYLLDALRNPVVLLTQLGAVDARNRFDVWGRLVSQVDAAGQTTTTNRDAPVAELPNGAISRTQSRGCTTPRHATTTPRPHGSRAKTRKRGKTSSRRAFTDTSTPTRTRRCSSTQRGGPRSSNSRS
jgi:YD repeat-containing protein